MSIPAPKSTLRAIFTPCPIPTPTQRSKFNLRRSTREIEKLKIQKIGKILRILEKSIKINNLRLKKLTFAQIGE